MTREAATRAITVEERYHQWLTQRYPKMDRAQIRSLGKEHLTDSYLQTVLGLISYTDQLIAERHPDAQPISWWRPGAETKRDT